MRRAPAWAAAVLAASVGAREAAAVVGAFHDAAPGEFPGIVFVGERPGFDGGGSLGEILEPARREKSFTCGGALIAPRVVLTAAHCVYNPAEGRDLRGRPRAVAVATGLDMKRLFGGGLDPRARRAIAPLGVEALETHPLFTGATGQADLALLLLPAGASDGLAAYPLARALPAVGAEVTVAGFGYTELGPRGPSGVWGVLHAGASRIAEIGGINFRTAGEADVCGGDSGSPVLAAVGGRVAVLGVASLAACTLEDGKATRVDAQLGWIRSVLARWGEAAEEAGPAPAASAGSERQEPLGGELQEEEARVRSLFLDRKPFGGQ